MHRPAFACLALAVLAVPLGAQDRSATVQAEVRKAADAAIPAAEAIAGDTARFIASVQPFGPLDLLVRRAANAAESNTLRNWFLGVVGAAAGIDPRPLVARWHCGEPCDAARRDSLVSRLPQLQPVVDEVRAMPRVDVIAAWPDGGYRVGVVSFDGKVHSVHAASPTAGLMPWRSFAAVKAAEIGLAALGTSDTAAARIVGTMRTLGIAAVVRDDGGSVRAVLAGSIGDNEAGLLFLATGAAPPAIAQELPDGRVYEAAAQVAPGVYFYVTS